LRGARVLTAAGSILVACLAMRTWVVFNSPPSLDHHYWTHLRIDSLTFGFVLAYVFHCRPEWWERLGRHRRLLLTLGALAIAPAGILRDDNPWSVSFGLSALYMGYGAILVACLSTAADLTWLDKTLHGPWTRWLAFIGLYSYPIYLWHVDMGPLVVMALARVGGRLNPSEAWFAATVVFAALSVGIGVVMSTLIERPFLSLRDRNYPPRAALVRMDIPESGPAASSMSAD
jgi:peptidoglycan/LPS O-acetylase OafA/YrhL